MTRKKLNQSWVIPSTVFVAILEKSWEHAKDVYTCFVDLGKVYSRVPREKLWGGVVGVWV